MRKTILFPAIALATGLFFAETSQAQPPLGPPPLRPGIGPGPGPGRPLPPIDLRPSPRIGVGISIGAPLLPPPHLHRPPVIVIDSDCEYYRVLYRDCPHDPWRVYRTYESHRLAHAVANQLREMGYESRVLHD